MKYGQPSSNNQQLPLKQKWMEERIKKIRQCWQLYIIILLPVLYLLIFCYYPMYGAQIAFKDFKGVKGIWGSPWAGLKHFKLFFNSYQFWKVISNTMGLSIYAIIAGFPFPIMLALSLNYVRKAWFKKTVQLVSYAPYFISTVVIVGMIYQFLAPRTGLINNLISSIAGK